MAKNLKEDEYATPLEQIFKERLHDILAHYAHRAVIIFYKIGGGALPL